MDKKWTDPHAARQDVRAEQAGQPTQPARAAKHAAPQAPVGTVTDAALQTAQVARVGQPPQAAVDTVTNAALHPAQTAAHRALLPTIIAVVLALIVAGVGIFAYLHFVNGSGNGAKGSGAVLGSSSGTTTTPYTSPYDFANLAWDEAERPSYVINGEAQSSLGVDVSDHQGSIDWSAVAADGIKFAYVRVGYRGTTEGSLFADETYDANVSGAQAAGLQVGVYFYSQATNVEEAQEEAAFVLQQLGGRYLELPVVFDHEDADGSRAADVDYGTLSEVAETFCSAIEAGGYETMLYGNYYDLTRYNFLDVSGSSGEGLYALGETPKRAIWFAEYGASEPSAGFDFAIWQYTNSGAVSGIGTAVDMNIMFRVA